MSVFGTPLHTCILLLSVCSDHDDHEFVDHVISLRRVAPSCHLRRRRLSVATNSRGL